MQKRPYHEWSWISNGGAGLGFDRDHLVHLLQNEIDLESLGIAEVVEARLQAAMNTRLTNLRRHPALEDRAPQGMVAELPRLGDPEQVAGQPGVEEVELRGLDGLLANVAVPRRQPVADEAGLQDRDPGARGVVGDAGVAAEAREVMQVPMTTSTCDRRAPLAGRE